MPTRKIAVLTLLLIATFSGSTLADAISDWNLKARKIVVQAGANTPQANRIMALTHTAMYMAANAISREYQDESLPQFEAVEGASLEAAVAEAAIHSLLQLLPSQRQLIQEVRQRSLANTENVSAINAGIKTGRLAVQTLLKTRKNDGHQLVESYRPSTAAGVYVPTTIPATPQWPTRKPWTMTSADQFLPPPPPALDSQQWARDLNEVKTLGAANSTVRTEEQTRIAKFWEATLPPIYHGVVHSVANLPGRSLTQNARLFSAVTRATDDAMIAVFQAKYHYAFWRPITAIRNADKDNNAETLRDASWRPYIPTPMHPEYPCAHCVVAGTVGTVLQADVGAGKMPLLTTQSNTAGGVTRSWQSVEAFMEEVALARIYDGVHYRFSSDAGTEMGIQIGRQAAAAYLR
jgi:hypothetical protein